MSAHGYSNNPYGAPPPVGPYGYAPPAPAQPAFQHHPAFGAPAAPINYGPSPSYAPPPPPAYGYAPPPPMGVIPPPMPMGMMVEQKNPGLAVALELLGGTFLQTFGIGHLYAGNVGVGLGLMFGYWALTAINVFLCFVLVGFVTWPLTWIAFMILSAVTANTAAKKRNMGFA